LEDLNDNYTIWSIDNDILQKIQRNLLKRLRARVAMDGDHFEQLL